MKKFTLIKEQKDSTKTYSVNFNMTVNLDATSSDEAKLLFDEKIKSLLENNTVKISDLSIILEDVKTNEEVN